MRLFLFLSALALILSVGGRPTLRPLPFDSGARAALEVARALGGGGRGLLEPYPTAAEPVLLLLRHAPPGLRSKVLEFGLARALGRPRDELDGFDLERFFSTYAERYPVREYPAIVLGSPGGGAVHLAALLDAPLLPACGLIGIRHKIHPDDMESYVATGLSAAQLLSPDGRFEIIVHYDPIHDRDLVGHAALLRVRLLSLPQVYKVFIREHLAPDGTLILVEDTYAWPQVELAPGVWLQVGGLGGFAPEEYLGKYPPPQDPIERPESEWGCPEGFARAVREFAAEGRYRFLPVRAGHPQELSRLAFRAYLAAGARQDVVLLDCFTTMDARVPKLTGIPPLHLPFHTRDGFEFALETLREHPVSKAFLALHPSFNPPPDMVGPEEWRMALGDSFVPLFDERRWPDDPYAPFTIARLLSQLMEECRLPVPLALSVDELSGLLP